MKLPDRDALPGLGCLIGFPAFLVAVVVYWAIKHFG